MDFDAIITGIRKAIYGREVREYIASSMEWTRDFVNQSIANIKELLRQAEAARGLGAVAEDVRRRGVDGDGSGVRRRVRVLLADVELQGFKFIVRHSSYFLSSVKYYLWCLEHRGYIRPKRKFALTRVSK